MAATETPPQQFKEAKAGVLRAEVQHVMRKHVRKEIPSSALSAILEDDEKSHTFISLLKNHVRLVKSRSSEFAHAQITIYDKALLNLTLDGRDTSRLSVMSLFAEEILGINTIEDSSFASLTKEKDRSDKVLDLGTGSSALNAFIDEPSARQGSHFTDTSLVGENHQAQAGAALTDSEHVTHLASEAVPKNSAAEKLLQTYAVAKDQHYAARNLSINEQLESAVFLRDTCENVMICLNRTDIAPDVMQEIENVCAVAANESIILNDGRKRKFDVTLQDRRMRFSSRNHDKAKWFGKNQREHSRELHQSAKGGYHNAFRSPNREKNANTSPRHGVRRFTYHGRDLEAKLKNDRQIRADILRERRSLRHGQPYGLRSLVYARGVDSYEPRR